jgi:hypothetical protein
MTVTGVAARSVLQSRRCATTDVLTGFDAPQRNQRILSGIGIAYLVLLFVVAFHGKKRGGKPGGPDIAGDLVSRAVRLNSAVRQRKLRGYTRMLCVDVGAGKRSVLRRKIRERQMALAIDASGIWGQRRGGGRARGEEECQQGPAPVRVNW